MGDHLLYARAAVRGMVLACLAGEAEEVDVVAAAMVYASATGQTVPEVSAEIHAEVDRLITTICKQIVGSVRADMDWEGFTREHGL